MKFWKTLFFFHLPIKKIDFITLKMCKFQILNVYLWLIYRKKCEFIAYTFFYEFWEIKFFWLLRPSKTSEALKKGPYSGFFTFKYALKE